MRRVRIWYLIAANGILSTRHPEIFARHQSDARQAQDYDACVGCAVCARGTPPPLPMTNIRYLSKDFESPMVVWVFGDDVATVLWNKTGDDLLIQMIRPRLFGYHLLVRHYAALKATAKL